MKVYILVKEVYDTNGYGNLQNYGDLLISVHSSFSGASKALNSTANNFRYKIRTVDVKEI